MGNISDDDGGGFYTMKLGQPVLEKNIFAGNWTRGGGVGAIRLSKEGRARIRENIIVNNPGGGVSSVDSYMELVDNVVMNNTAASGVAYSNLFSYMQPSIVRGNIIRENEKGAFTVKINAGPDPVFEKNNVDDQSINQGSQNYNRAIKFENDRITGEISQIIFDPLNVKSRIKSSTALEGNEDIIGRIIKIGDRWGVISAYNDNIITAWGDLYVSENQEMFFEILPSYTQQ